MRWSDIGTRNISDASTKERIRATNAVFAVLLGVLALLLLSSLAFGATLMAVFIAISVGILLFTLLLHALGFHLTSRTLMSTLPVLVSSCIQGAYQMKGQLPNASGWVFIVAFQVLPFLLFASHEKRPRIVAVIVNLLLAASYEKFNALIELDTPPPTPPVQVLVTNLIGMVMILRLLYTIDNMYAVSNAKNLDLIKRIEEDNRQQEQARYELNKTVEQLNLSKVEDARRAWTTRGLADAARIMREENDIATMTDKLISYLVKYVGANQGGLFILRRQEEVFDLVACYAYERKKFLEKRIPVGEGLLGQCYYEKEPLYMTEVPTGYVHITSGLGLAPPRSILLVPLVSNNEVFGVLELAAFQTFEKHQITFLADAGESLAVTLHSMEVAERTKTLLEESRMMADQMKIQEEAMRQNLEEIAATQEAHERTEAELRMLVSRQEREIQRLRALTEASHRVEYDR